MRRSYSTSLLLYKKISEAPVVMDVFFPTCGRVQVVARRQTDAPAAGKFVAA